MSYSYFKSAALILAITLLVSGTAYALFFFPFFFKSESKEKHEIKKIVQTVQERIPNALLAEVIDLSIDRPTTFSAFDLEKAEKKLLATHAIESVRVSKIQPNTLFVNYKLREPIGYVADLTNTFVDENGFLFPSYPFYTPKRLPEIFFGLPHLKTYWGRKLSQKKMEVVRTLLDHLKGAQVTEIDLSLLEEPSLGRKEIVVVLNVKGKARYLRLHFKEYISQLHHYFSLEKSLLSKEEPASYIVDLRIPSCAYLEKK